MTSLQDIWDTPADVVSSRPKSPPILVYDDDGVPASNPKRPSASRPRNTLFLDSGSEDEAPTTSKTRYSKPGSSKPDIDAFWEDLDDGFQELPPSLDVAALKSQTEAKLALTPHQILPSSSPPRDTGDGAKDEAKDKKKGQTQQKTKRALLNEGRILGPDGFPVLIKQTKNFKPKGKGHELSDLNRLMNVYQFWSHKMYPNTQFADTVQRVEKLCHSKRMHVALGVWRDEAKGLINGRKVSDTNDADNEDDDDDDVTRPLDIPVATEDERSSPAPSRPTSIPPSSASEGGGMLDDDFDIDAMLREEEAAQAAAPSTTSTTSHRPPASSSAAIDDDEDMWDAVMGDIPDEPFVLQERQPTNGVRKPPTSTTDEDEDTWNVMNEMEAQVGLKTTPPGPPMVPPSESSSEQSAVSAGTSAMMGVDPTRRATNDDGWDEMYA